MKQCLLKSLGVAVPQIALGTVELGLPYGFGLDGKASQPTFEEASRLVHAALDHGIRFIDTARAYGSSEEVLGRCLEGRHSNLVLATKVGPLKLDGSDQEIGQWITLSVEQSLRALRVDSVDWLMLHSLTPDQWTQLPRFVDALERMREQGKFRVLGASVYFDALRDALNTREFTCVQLAASALDRRPEALLAGAPAGSKDIIVRSVLLRGALTDRYHLVPGSMFPLRDAIARLDGLASEAGLTLTELAYRYAADSDRLMLVGTASIKELQQAVAFVDRGPLPSDLKLAIQAMPILEDHYLNPAQWPASETQNVSATA